MKAAESELTFSRMSLSPHRENEVVLQLSGFRYLTEHLIEDVLFGGSSFTPLSRQVITRRVLNRLKRKGLILETPRLVGPAGGTARLMSFLTAKGYNLARSLNPGLPSRQPNLRGTSLMGHGLMCAEVALAFRRAARPNPSSTGSATGRPLSALAQGSSCQTRISSTRLRTGPLRPSSRSTSRPKARGSSHGRFAGTSTSTVAGAGSNTYGSGREFSPSRPPKLGRGFCGV